MIRLGKLVQGDLREIWPTEPEFSKWLAQEENFVELGKTIEIAMVSPECETSVGSFSADICAQEDGGERRIIIENQLESTNHDHLGKIITYAAGKNAKIIVWIVRQARDEHREAIKWLNENSSEEIGFFLLEIAVWKIGNSDYAPLFKVIEKPNDWTRQIRSITNFTETQERQRVFWTKFMEYAMQQSNFARLFNSRLAQPQHWLDLAAGSAEYHISLTVDSRKKKLGCAIYIPHNKVLFDSFASKKAQIEAELGFPMDWRRLPENKKASRIIVTRQGDIEDESAYGEYFKWFCDCAVNVKKTFAKFLESGL